MKTLRLCLWSGPRNVSTALMYSFAQRADTRVIDEPFYAHYLRVSGAEHPGRDQVLAAMDNDGDAVVRNVVLGPCDRSVLFMKQMAHHLVDLDLGFLEQTTHVLLVRDPADMLRSLVHQLPDPKLRDTGFAVQSELFERLIELGHDPPVLESRQLLLDPRGVLTQLCNRLGIDFDPAMLSWPAGARPEDGVWAPHWYHNVHRSQGFAPFVEKIGAFPKQLEPLLQECRPHYQKLFRSALKAGAGPEAT